MTISVLCMSRGRPDLAKRMADSARLTASILARVHIYFYLDEDDPQLSAYSIALGNSRNTSIMVGPSQDAFWRWNRLAKASEGDLLMMMGDDGVFMSRGWDQDLLEAYGKAASPLALFSFDDVRGEKGKSHPHPVFSRKLYETLGYMCPPMFKHWYADTWLVELAQQAGIFHFVPGVVIQHAKPSDEGVYDTTHKRLRAKGNHERDTMAWQVSKRFLENEVEMVKQAVQREGVQTWKERLV